MSKSKQSLEKTLKMSLDGSLGVTYTLQGEGRFAGLPSVFVRLSSCNLRCQWRNPDGSVDLCDTPASSFEAKINPCSIEKVLREVVSIHCPNVVITGGEPFFQPDVVVLIRALVEKGFFVTVETNGTIFRPSQAQLISLSPKLRSATLEEESGRLPTSDLALRKFLQEHDFQIKFVLHTPKDLEEVVLFAQKYSLPKEKIFCMPQGKTPKALHERAAWIIPFCLRHGFCFCPRIQICCGFP